MYTDGTYGFFRNDTIAKIVYMLNSYTIAGSASDSLLYDFSKLQGDTVYSILGKYVIDSIKTILIGNFQRPLDHVHFPFAAGQGAITAIIEGIGSEKGLFYDPDNWEGYDQLICFSQNNKKLYPDTNGVCQTINSISVYSQEKIKIFPNPANDKIYIEGIDITKAQTLKF